MPKLSELERFWNLATVLVSSGRSGFVALGYAPLIARAQDRPSEDLRRLNQSVDALIRRVSPSVVQILVTGYGPLEEGDRGNANSIIGRQRAIGSGFVPALSLADYRKLGQGEMVFAFGSPEGLRNSVTMGVVSAVARQTDPDSPMVYIQTTPPSTLETQEDR